MKNPRNSENYKWFILILGAVTNAMVVAIPTMGLSVLLPDITKDLNMSLVEAGLLWGISSLPIIFVSLVAGALGDRIAPKWVIIAGCILIAIVGGLRALTPNFFTLVVLVFLFGVFAPLITLSNIKNAGVWFTSRELSMANGVLSMGMALGFMVGSVISGTLILPWLGGWRNVFLFYGAVAMLFPLIWLFTPVNPGNSVPAHPVQEGQSFLQGGMQIFKLRDIWLLGIVILLVGGSIQGFLGYLPLFLNQFGWSKATADSTMASFHLASLIGVMPIALWSDRLGTRKKILIAIIVVFSVGMGLVGLVPQSLVGLAVILAGVVRDGFMTIFLTMVTEIRGVSRRFSGTATGFSMVFIGFGNLLAPPVGNAFASLAPGAPFWFWTGLSVLGCLCALLIIERETSPAEKNGAPLSAR